MMTVFVAVLSKVPFVRLSSQGHACWTPVSRLVAASRRLQAEVREGDLSGGLEPELKNFADGC